MKDYSRVGASRFGLAMMLGVLFFGIISSAAAAPVELSPGTDVTANDIAQFNALWMGAAEARRETYAGYMKNRQAWAAWGIGDESTAMVRLWELTRDPQHLTHLKGFAEITLRYRDDHHPGDDYPAGNNPDCMKCQPPFIDHERGDVQAAWGSGRSGDYVNDGGLTPVDAVTSGVYLYPSVAFARLVAEDSSLHGQYGADAVRFANAGIETFQTFVSQFDYTPAAGGYIEGTFNRPQIFPTAQQCDSATQEAVTWATLYSGRTGKDLT